MQGGVEESDQHAEGQVPTEKGEDVASPVAGVAESWRRRDEGLEAGADDYVCKPFSTRELPLRIRALLRRTATGGASLPELLRDGDVSLDLGRRQARLSQRVVPLTTRDHDLLQFLMHHPGVNFTRQDLLERVWSWHHGDLSTVTVHVRRLREKIEDDAARPRRLLTVFGVGYRYEYVDQR